jgi:hypothetical protein
MVGGYLSVIPMTRIATELAQKIVAGTAEGIDTANLYIAVQKIDNDTITVEYGYKNEQKIPVSLFGVMYGIDKKPVAGGQTKLSGEVIGRLATSKPETAKGECRSSYIVEYSVVNSPGGWGRLLYYVLMHYAGNHGITADRVKSSGAAVSAWNRLWEDSEVNKLSLDDFYDPFTPEKSDDCNLASSGAYGEKELEKNAEAARKERALHSTEAHKWNRFLRGYEKAQEHEEDPDAPEQTPEQRAERAEKYKKEKASKLNYVYVADSRDAVSILSDAGKLSFNGKFAPKQKTVAPTATRTNVPQPISLREEYSLFAMLYGD